MYLNSILDRRIFLPSPTNHISNMGPDCHATKELCWSNSYKNACMTRLPNICNGIDSFLLTPFVIIFSNPAFLTNLGLILLTWINFNIAMAKWVYTQWSMRLNYSSIPKFQWLHNWSFGVDKQCHLTLHNGCTFLYMLGLNLNHVSNGGPWTYIPRDKVVFHNSGNPLLCDCTQ